MTVMSIKVVKIKSFKKSNVTIIISMNENMQISNKSTAYKKSIYHHTRMDAHI